jgi:hypothetical protein
MVRRAGAFPAAPVSSLFVTIAAVMPQGRSVGPAQGAFLQVAAIADWTFRYPALSRNCLTDAPFECVEADWAPVYLEWNCLI